MINRSSDQQAVGIIKTFPLAFFREMTPAEFAREWRKLNSDDYYWQTPMPSRPRIEVVYCYVVIGNRLRYRVNIAGFEPGGERVFEGGRRMAAPHWMILTGPVVKPEARITMRGFQGFRYTGLIF